MFMEPKKNPSFDLSRKSSLFFNMGLVLTLCLVIVIFEWKFYDDGSIVSLGSINDNFEEMLEIPPTEQLPPPPPKIQQPRVIEVKDEEITEEIDVDLDVEIEEDSHIEDIVLNDAPPEEEAEEILTIVEEMPSFPGGNDALRIYLQKNLKYTPLAQKMGLEGKVFVQFVVGKDGTLSEIKVIRGIGAGLDEEAVRVMTNSPKWNPGKQRGRPVKTRIVVPLSFTLN